MIGLARKLIKLIIVLLFLIFTVYNFDSVKLKFTNLYVFESPLAVIVFISFLSGFALGVASRIIVRKSAKPAPEKATL